MSYVEVAGTVAFGLLRVTWCAVHGPQRHAKEEGSATARRGALRPRSQQLPAPFCLPAGASMRQPGGHGVDDQKEEDEAEAEKEVAERAGNVSPPYPLVPNSMLLELVFRH